MLLVVILMTFLMMRQIGGNPFRQSEWNVPESLRLAAERPSLEPEVAGDDHPLHLVRALTDLEDFLVAVEP